MTYLPQIRILVPSAQVSSYSTGSFNLPSARGAFVDASNRGVFAGGWNGSSRLNVIDYINIASTGNATDFGDLSTSFTYMTGGGSSTRGVFANGTTEASTGGTNIIEYITIASTGNSTDFGDRTTTSTVTGCAMSNSTIMVMISNTSYTNDYITIATTGNATSWGASISGQTGDENSCTASSPTRGLHAAGYKNNVGGGTTGPKNLINYITFATTGSFTSFGNLIEAGYSGKGGTSNGTRAVFKADFSNNDMEYVTIATTGNATFFGDVSANLSYVINAGDCSAGGRGIMTGSSGILNVIEYITIASTGNTTDFGDLTVARNTTGSTSAAHGGL
jgi:hypothetical protein